MANIYIHYCSNKKDSKLYLFLITPHINCPVNFRMGATITTENNTYASSCDEEMEVDVEVVILTEEEDTVLGKWLHELVLLLSEKQKEIDMATSSTESAILEIQPLKVVNFELKNRLQIERFELQRYSSADKLIKCYTCFSMYGALRGFFHIRTMASSMQTVLCCITGNHTVWPKKLHAFGR